MKETMIEQILTRRSIRKYRDEQVGRDKLNQIIECALLTPSALNKQPWQVRIIQQKDIMANINQTFVEWARGKDLPGSAARANEVGFSVFHHAPTLIVVAADKDNHYAEGDCGMLAQNIMLSAHILDLGSCTIGNVANIINTSTTLRSALNIGDEYKVLFGIAIGYPAEKPEPKPRDRDKFQWIS